MNDFDGRWRTLVRSARRAAEAPLAPPPLALARQATGVAGPRGAESGWRVWLAPVAAMALLYALTLPLLDGALAATASLRVSLRDVPRPPTLPSPPVPPAPLLPKPPSLPRTARAMEFLFSAPKEARP